MILSVLPCQFWTKFTQTFPEARHHRADQNSKIIAIEPMNRKAGPFRATKAQRSEQTEGNNYDPGHVDFGQCARVANFPIVCVSKRFFSVRLISSVMARGFPTVWSKI
jgi:hypothetical protein